MALHDLFERQQDDPELIPKPHNVEVRLHLEGSADDFLKVLERVVAILPVREVLPGTQFARLRAGRPTVKTTSFVEVAGFDGERTVRTVSDRIAVYVEGQVLIPAQRLRDALKQAPESQVAIEVQGQVLTLRSGRALWTINLPKGSDLSVVPAAWSRPLYPVERESFFGALHAVQFATGDLQGRPSMAQIQVKNQALLASDGIRIHRMDVPSLPPDAAFSIPASARPELERMLRESRSDVFELGWDDRFVEVEVDTTKLTMQQLAVPFPSSVDSIIHTASISNTDRLVVDVVPLARAVARVRVNADPDWAQIHLTVQAATTRDGHNLVVHARDRNGNAAQETLACQYHGSRTTVELVFNKQHLSDLLAIYGQESIPLHLGSDSVSKASAVFCEEGESGLTVVLQQMRALR